MKTKKIIALILALVMTLQVIAPIGVLALEKNENNNISTELKDGSKNVDFNYKFSLSETFDLIYNQETIEKYIIAYINTKIGTEYIVDVDESENTYHITKDGVEIYTGSFSYQLYQNLEIECKEDTIKSITDYIEENTNFKENIVVKKIDNKNYEITINGITHSFEINVKNQPLSEQEIIEKEITTEEGKKNLIVPNTKITTNASQSIEYQTHVEIYGWQDSVVNGQLSGTTGESKRLESIKIKLNNQDYIGDIKYRTHVESYGWLDWVANGKESGTTGQNKRLEAIQIQLTGEMANHYDIYYRVHAQQFGWLDWAKNGEKAGTEGYSYRLEAIEIVLVQKGESAPGATTRPYVQRYIGYETHAQNIGWQAKVYDGVLAGTTGQNKRLESIKITLDNQEYTGNVEYQSYIQTIGWENTWRKNGEQSGTTGQEKSLEAIRIRLTGEMANHYDIYYRVHAQQFGWLDWAKNGEEAGTTGYSYRLEAIEIVLVQKGESAPGVTTRPYIQKYIGYETHVQNIGWQKTFYDGEVAGTISESKRIEAIKINLQNQEYAGNVEYKSYVEESGWENNWSQNGGLSGTIGESKRIEAIQIRLTGAMADNYDIYYRVHAQQFGWLDWAKNGEKAGTEGFGYRLEAIEIILVKKGASAPGSTERAFVLNEISYQAHSASIGWQDKVYSGSIAGTIGKNLEAFVINNTQSNYAGSITYASYVNSEGWQEEVESGKISGTTGRNLSIEAIKMNITGELSNYYDIYYSVYVSNIGWLDWAKNGEETGNVGYGNSIQAIKVQLLEKGNDLDGDNIYSEDELKINYTSYIEDSGWQETVNNGALSGTTGQSKKIESIKISINKKTIKGSVAYSTHVSDIGWQDYVSEGDEAGKIGERIEAIKIKLTGELAEVYDIYYRVHVAQVGWMTWTSNDNPAGTITAGKQIEAIEIQLVKKGDSAPENIGNNVDSSYLEARWETGEDGNRYYYDVFGNLVTSGSYVIGDTTHYFGPTGVYLGTENLLVIDVSAHQKKIDWQQVAGSGIYGVIIRISAGCDYEDSELKNNIEGVKKYNIPYGIYIYSYAENYAEGVLYGQFTQSIINKYEMNPTLGIYLDLESNGVTQYMGPNEYTQVVQGFMSVLPHANIYTYTNYANSALNTPYLRSYITWIAHYAESCGYTGSYKMWQYTSDGSLPGINGRVDMNILYSIEQKN